MHLKKICNPNNNQWNIFFFIFYIMLKKKRTHTCKHSQHFLGTETERNIYAPEDFGQKWTRIYWITKMKEKYYIYILNKFDFISSSSSFITILSIKCGQNYIFLIISTILRLLCIFTTIQLFKYIYFF